jgi:apolipoprotein N-acyltransferase
MTTPLSSDARSAAVPDDRSLGDFWSRLVVWSVVALASFHAAQVFGIAWLLIPCTYALIELSRAPTSRKVFYPMLALGYLFYAPHLAFFRGIFGPAATVLWLILAFWIALFGLLLRLVRLRFGSAWMLALAPFIWTGLEYFRCELYYLRFGWLTFGMANHTAMVGCHSLGLFGLGFVLLCAGGALQFLRSRKIAAGLMVAVPLLLTGLNTVLLQSGAALAQTGLPVAGVQLEFPNDQQVVSALSHARAKHPDAQLFMLSEYTFQQPVPQRVRDWCASNHVYLVVGGKEPLGDTNFYNTAYVVGTNGAIVHRQVKSVPIQFFKDGLPAPDRKVWDSPWGKLGILICYDLSYTRVVDDFVRQGAIALLNPTMDVSDWGEQQHRLHSRVVPMRAAEYGIPIFRVCSSGISELVSPTGRVLASAPFPGDGDIIAGQIPLNATPRLPLDRWLACGCVAITALALLAALIPSARFRIPSRSVPVKSLST